MSWDAIRATPIAAGLLALCVLIASPGLLGSRVAATIEAEELVRQLQGLPAWLDAPSAQETRRQEIYTRLHALGSASVPALAVALGDPDVSLRRNAALALGILGEGLVGRQLGTRVNISAALPALMVATQDADPHVRQLSAQALGDIGAEASPAVSLLIGLLGSDDEEDRASACIALHDIGAGAHTALPALRGALADRSPDVRGYAQFAIAAIEGPRISLLN